MLGPIRGAGFREDLRFKNAAIYNHGCGISEVFATPVAIWASAGPACNLGEQRRAGRFVSLPRKDGCAGRYLPDAGFVILSHGKPQPTET
jgi:hypothetical protein